ncbi:hypothetical protein HPB47_021791 [Ixodes persulcatus]|uniref:Uncharacterized protein n=1 Tax=Ixodes persulcatus TaxID=34615 RepID=A0AC60QEY0_IXOPE|nr:hypothetical protein HPB47_021791 [Ixodes persulcatus]
MMTKQRQALPLSDKVDIINRVEHGEKKSDVAAPYKIPRSTLSTILKNKTAFRDKARERPNADSRRIRKPAYDEVEKALYQWFLAIRARILPVSGPMLQSKARDLASLLKVEGFTAGSGWLQRFKDRYLNVGKVEAGEKCAVDTEGVKKWIDDNRPYAKLLCGLTTLRASPF